MKSVHVRVAVFAALVFGSVAGAQTYQLRSGVMSAGGTPHSGGQHNANGTLGQSTPIGVAAAAGDTVRAGFWYTFEVGTATGTPGILEPLANRLHQNYPNPFNPTTNIDYDVSEAVNVDIIIFNVRGQRVKTLVDAYRAPGRYSAVWDGVDDRGQSVASGIYFYRIRIGDFQDVKKMIVLK